MLLVTGMARSGTSWVGKMLEAGGECVYVNEPLNPRHPPGRSPGILDAPVTHEYQYIGEHNHDLYAPAFADTLAFRYRLGAELRQNRTPFDLLKAARNTVLFSLGRWMGKRLLLDDPYAVLASAWLVRTFGAQVVVVVRHPAGVLASYQRLGYRYDFGNLLDQPELMKELLEPHRSAMEAVPPDDLARTVGVLWAAIHDAVAQFKQELPNIHVVRYEDLATAPIDAFRELFCTVGLPFNERARRAVVEGSTGSSRPRSHAWQLSRGSLLSRTAYRPMDSRAQAFAWKQHVAAADLRRLRAATAGVAELHYASDSWR
jgi:hypothetical protein